MAQTFSPTSRYTLWRRLGRLAWLIPVVIFAFLSLIHSIGAIATAASSPNPGLALLTFATANAAEALITGLPLWVGWHAFCRFMRKRARLEATFDAKHDLDYYRDKLDGATPALVSMLADLRIEPRKDMAAALLRLKMQKIIEFDHAGTARVTHKDQSQLAASDKFIIDRIEQGGITASDSAQWASLAETEALNTPFLVRYGLSNELKEERKTQTWLEGCVVPFLSVMASAMLGVVALFGPLGTSLDDFLLGTGDTPEFAAVVQQDPAALVSFTLFTASIIIGIYGVLFPLAKVISTYIMNQSRTDEIRRTPEGEDVTECLWGLRNWIRDFTNISQADRDAVAVWDDFFVYAVALDEGTNAVSQILPLKDISLDDVLAFISPSTNEQRQE